MTLVTKRALVGVSTVNPAPNHRLAGTPALTAGETLDAADACTLRDGRVYKASGAAADANARIFGWTAGPASAGEAVTLYDHVTIEYGTGLSMGTLFYLSGDTPGGLDTEPSTGGTVPCAVALDSTRVHVQSTWGGGAASGGGALTATYLDLPAITAPGPMTQPLNHAWVYLDAADTTLHALINGTAAPLGGGGSLTPPATLTGTDPNTTPLTILAADAQAVAYLILRRDADWQGVNFWEAQDETGAPVAYLDENGGFWAGDSVTTGGAVTGATLQVSGNSTITGSLAVTSLNSSGAVLGASATLTGALAAGSAGITGAVTAGSAAATGTVSSGLGLIAGDGASAGVLVLATGAIQIFNSTEPATPSGGGVLWVAGGALKYKGSSGTITTLAPA